MATEQLTREEFDAHMRKKTLRLSFVGMSNAGKSYRSKVLRDEFDFFWYEIDGEIQKALGFADMSEISNWMGYPTAPGYTEREKKYLDLEDEFTRHAGMRMGGRNLVFDTTGSVIHLSPATHGVLKGNTLMVHLDVGEESLTQMAERFFLEPKPVAWCDHFHMQSEETESAALRRCFPMLLNERLARYRTLAHLNIPASEVFDRSGKETLAIIRSHL